MSGRLDAVRAAHPHPQSPEVAAPEGLLETAQAVVPAQTLAFLEPHLAEGQLDLVVDHEYPLDGDLVPARGLDGRLAGQIHEGHGQQQHHADARHRPSPARPWKRERSRGQTVAPPQLLPHHEADVVAVELVLGPGIAQRDDQVDRVSVHSARSEELLLALAGRR